MLGSVAVVLNFVCMLESLLRDCKKKKNPKNSAAQATPPPPPLNTTRSLKDESQPPVQYVWKFPGDSSEQSKPRTWEAGIRIGGAGSRSRILSQSVVTHRVPQDR